VRAPANKRKEQDADGIKRGKIEILTPKVLAVYFQYSSQARIGERGNNEI
jgi:hypothetical protein